MRIKRVTSHGHGFVDSMGRVRFLFDIDGRKRRIGAIFHDAPTLSDAAWEACLQDLGVACLLQISSATLSRSAVAMAGVGNHQWARPAATALRIEQVAEARLSVNHVPFDLKISVDPKCHTQRLSSPSLPNNVLLLMGGGKDSLYSYWLLRSAGYNVVCFYMTEASRTWQQLRRPFQHLASEATQCRAFLNANQMGWVETAYGTPFYTSFQIGLALFLAVPYALAHKCRYIAVGAEKSANGRTGLYKSLAVRHQYEKSESFFRLVNVYLQQRWHGSLEVVSPLHGLYDLGIYARFLSSGNRLIHLQSSCGGSNGYRRHCGKCAKCAFVAALFCGLSSDQHLFEELFPLNPLNDRGLWREWYQGRFDRPRSCVGSLEELRVSLRLGRARGWDSFFHRYDAVDLRRTPGPDDLLKYLSLHESTSLPNSMRRRLLPFLGFDTAELSRLDRSLR